MLFEQQFHDLVLIIVFLFVSLDLTGTSESAASLLSSMRLPAQVFGQIKPRTTNRLCIGSTKQQLSLIVLLLVWAFSSLHYRNFCYISKSTTNRCCANFGWVGANSANVWVRNRDISSVIYRFKRISKRRLSPPNSNGFRRAAQRRVKTQMTTAQAHSPLNHDQASLPHTLAYAALPQAWKTGQATPAIGLNQADYPRSRAPQPPTQGSRLRSGLARSVAKYDLSAGRATRSPRRVACAWCPDWQPVRSRAPSTPSQRQKLRPSHMGGRSIDLYSCGLTQSEYRLVCWRVQLLDLPPCILHEQSRTRSYRLLSKGWQPLVERSLRG